MRCFSHSPKQSSRVDLPVVVGGARMTAAAIRRARDVGAVAVVAGGIDDQDLKEFLGYDLGVAITGSERTGLTLIVTEGFGDIAMAGRTYELLVGHAGKQGITIPHTVDFITTMPML